MIQRLCFLFLLFATTLYSQEIEIPDDLFPIEGASKILYSYEFDDAPYFLERLNQDIFLIMTLDGNDIELHNYSLSKDTTELKLEFEYDDDETIENYLIKENKLLLFTNYSTKKAVFGTTGFFDRLITINLDSYQVEDCRVVFTNYNKDYMEDYEPEDDLEFCSDSVSDYAFTIDFDKQEVLPNDYRGLVVTFNDDSTVKNYFGVTYNNETRETYLFSGNLNLKNMKTTSSLNKLNDGKTWIYMNYIYLDDESNVYFIGNQSDKEKKTRNIVAGKITPGGVITNKILNIPFSTDEGFNTLGSFELFKNEKGKLSLFGYSKHYEDEDFYEKSNSAIILIELELNSLEIKYKQKKITIDEGIALNGDNEKLRFNTINKVIETNDGYTLLTETNETTWNMSDGHYFFYAYSENINLISLDKELKIKWNKHIYRDFNDRSYKTGPKKSKFFDQNNSISTYLKPEVYGDIISFTYSTTVPKKEIVRVSFDVNTGEKIYQQSIFENDGTMSYFPLNHFRVGDDEYVGVLSEDNNYIVRYKLFK